MAYTLKFYKQLLLVASVLTAVLVWYLFSQQEYFVEWREVQKGYQALLEERAEEYPIQVRQVFLEDLNRIDRCISCHAGVENPQMVDAPQPYKTHPGNYLENHPIELYGCVICHGGQGRALNKKEAHAGLESHAFWNNPILPKEYIESSCGICHDLKKTEKEAPHLFRGKELVATLGCQGCHAINGTGGSLGLSLDEQGTYSTHHYMMQHLDGEHTTWNWLEKHFFDPQKIVPDSLMKKQEMTVRDAKDLTTFMLSLYGKQAYASSRTPQDRYELIANHFGSDKLNGEQLYNQMCAVCHGGTESPTRGKLDKQYNQYFPVLLSEDFASSAPRDYIIQTIREGHPGTLMSGFESGLTPAMIDKIANYIKGLGTDEKLAAYNVQGDQDRGGSLFQKICAECHGSYGEGGKGPSLRNRTFQEYAPDAFIAKTIRDGRAETEMTALHTMEPEASEQEIADLVAYIRQLPEIKIGSAAGVIGWENFIDADKYPGAIAFYNNCSSCHSIGEGDRKGPDLKDVLQRREKQWVYQQIADPEGLIKSGDKIANDLAKQFDRIMENPGIPADEIEQIMTFLEDPDEGKAIVAEAMVKAAAESQGNADRGRQLFTGQLVFKNQGSSCLACHSVPGLGLFGGGNLGLDLLKSELTSIEIASSLTNVKYKVMKEIYTDKPLDADEINDIVAYIQEARTTKYKKSDGVWFALLGIFGLIVWFVIIQIFWFKRLKSVRKDLVERSRR